MENNANLVSVGAPLATGAIFIAPSGTPLPTDASSTLNAAFKCLGYASEDGVTISEDSDTNELKAWGGVTVRVTNSSFSETIAFTPMQIDEDVMKATYGADSVSYDAATGKMTVKHGVNDIASVEMVIETIPAPDMKRRYVAPSAKLTERGDASANGSDSDGRELTFTCQPDGDGVTIYEYIEGFQPTDTSAAAKKSSN